MILMLLQSSTHLVTVAVKIIQSMGSIFVFKGFSEYKSFLACVVASAGPCVIGSQLAE